MDQIEFIYDFSLYLYYQLLALKGTIMEENIVEAMKDGNRLAEARGILRGK